MKRVRALLLRLLGLFRKARRDAELDEELQSHLALAVEDGLRSGLDVAEARRRALVALGGIEPVKEAYRDQRGLPSVEAALLDLRYAARTLAHNRSFTAVAIATLAVGIGASTTMFSVAEAVLLRSLPYPEPHRLVRITETNPLKGWTSEKAAPANFVDWRESNTVFSGMAGHSTMNTFLTEQGEPRVLRALACTADLFDVLGVRPTLGRSFEEEETFEGKHRVAILSYGLWQRSFGGDPAVVGREISLDGAAYSVVGIMPSDFFFPTRDVQLWKPFGIKPTDLEQTRRPHWMSVIARLRPAVTLRQAAEDMRAIAARLERTYPDTNTKMGIRLDGYRSTLSAEKRPALLMLLAAVGVLFLVVCSNVANLQLGRGATRRREFAIRHALGADRGRLVRQLLTEGLCLSLAGGTLGLALAAAAREALVRFAPDVIPRFTELRLNLPVVLFATVVTLVTPMLCGLGPALAASRTGFMGDRSEARTGSGRFLRDAFVGCEVALSVVLVVGAALLVRSLVRLEAIDPGFTPERAVSFSVSMPGLRYPSGAHTVRAVQEIERRLLEEPDVKSAGASVILPLQGFAYSGDATVEGRGGDDYERELRHNMVTPGYFRAMGTPLLRGRSFDESDTEKSVPVTVVNQTLERVYFRGKPAAGQRIKFGRPQDADPWVTIVGVVADQRQDSLDVPVRPEAYAPFTQEQNDFVQFVVRGEASTEALVAAARRAVRHVDPALPIFNFKTLMQLARASTKDELFRTSLLSGFAAIALFLAALGVYGVLAYAVTQRTREIGVRMTLGAPRGRLFRMVVRDGMRPVLTGAALGLPLAYAAAWAVRSLLFGVGPMDPSSYAIAAVVLGMASVVACVVPAAQALRVDPMVCLRDE